MDYGKSEEDVKWVGTDELKFDWDHFKTLADFDYEIMYDGSLIVGKDLIIVGDGWWLERAHQDYEDRWAFRTTPIEPDLICDIVRIQLSDDSDEPETYIDDIVENLTLIMEAQNKPLVLKFD